MSKFSKPVEKTDIKYPSPDIRIIAAEPVYLRIITLDPDAPVGIGLILVVKPEPCMAVIPPDPLPCIQLITCLIRFFVYIPVIRAGHDKTFNMVNNFESIIERNGHRHEGHGAGNTCPGA